MWVSLCEEKLDYSTYLRDFIPDMEDMTIVFPTNEEFVEIIKYLTSWKASGIDGIYNFFIKRYSALHASLYALDKETCMHNPEVEDWFYRGITYLIPKGVPTQGGDFRTITCIRLPPNVLRE